MTYLFISDLHLSPDHPRLIQGFLDLLTQYQHKNTQLYILGDWFNAWIGDDNTAPWLDNIVQHLKQFNDAGNQIYFQAGNRDFVLGKKFLQQFSGILLTEPAYLQLGTHRLRVEHGDALCTDDIAYQRFKKIIRNPIVLTLLKSTPLAFRQKLAQGFRQKSQKANQVKDYSIMDVNPHAVERALESADVLIHGHTHRPEVHHLHGKQRIVLGDWREKTSEAMILVLSEPDLAVDAWTLTRFKLPS